MNARRLAALGGVLAVLVAFCFAIWKREQPVEERPSPLADVPLERWTEITLTGASLSTTTLVQKDGRWRLSAPVSDEVDPSSLGPLVGALRDFTVGSVVSEGPARHDRYEVNVASATRLTVRVSGADKPVLDILIGKPTTNYSNSYLRFPDSNDVRTADGLSAFVVKGDASRFRLRKLFAAPAASVDRIVARGKLVETSLARSSATWTNEKGRPVPDVKAAGARDALVTLRAVGFDDAAPLGAVEGEFTLFAGTTPVRLQIGATAKNGGEPVRRAAVDGRPAVLLVPEADIDRAVAALKATR